MICEDCYVYEIFFLFDYVLLVLCVGVGVVYLVFELSGCVWVIEVFEVGGVDVLVLVVVVLKWVLS